MTIPMATLRHRLPAANGHSRANGDATTLLSVGTKDLSPIERERNEWTTLRKDLPPQITGPYIRVISIGGIIGTGLFLGTATSLRDGGPLGMVIGYFLTGTIVYAIVTSLAEMVAYQPGIGGPVGLADVYVDRALGFAMGWNAWYHWTITLPAELSAATTLARFFLDRIGHTESKINLTYVVTGIMLSLAVLINVLGRYGQFETIFASLKITVIIILIITGIVIDFMPLSTIKVVSEIKDPISSELLTCVSDTFNLSSVRTVIGVKYFKCPGAFVQYRDIPGVKGNVLGVWSVMMQAIFAYAGSEVPGIAGSEVENPGKNIPRAANNILTRIFLFYVLSVFVAGLGAPYTHSNIKNPAKDDSNSFVLSSPFVIAMETAGLGRLTYMACAFFLMSAWSAATSDVYISSRYFYFLARRGHAPRFMDLLVSWQDVKYAILSALRRHPSPLKDEKRLVVPVYGILIAVLVGCLVFLPSISHSAEQAFYWLSSLTSAAVTLSWISMMITYLRWHAGTQHAEKTEEGFNEKYPELCDNTRRHRSRLQPYLAWYAMLMCYLILLLHGWVVFNIKGVRKIAQIPADDSPESDAVLGSFTLLFVTSYLPVPVFLLLVFGYKLIKQSNFVQLHEMDFRRAEIEVPKDEIPPSNIFGKLLNLLV